MSTEFLGRPKFSEADVAKIFAARGYVVIGTHYHLKPGTVVPCGFIDDAVMTQPVYVLGETDRADHAEQCKLLGAWVPSYPAGWPLFYRVGTD